MLMFGHFRIFFLIIGAILWIMASERICRLNQIIAEIGVRLLVHPAILGLKLPGLGARPDEPRQLRHLGMRWKGVNLAQFGENPSRLHRANPWNAGQGIGKALQFFDNGRVQGGQGRRQGANRGQRQAEYVSDTVGEGWCEPVGGFRHPLQFLDNGRWIGEPIPTSLDHKLEQGLWRGRGNLVWCHPFINQGSRRGSKQIGKRVAFVQGGKMQKEMRQKITLFAGELLDEMVSKACQALERQMGLVAAIGQRMPLMKAEIFRRGIRIRRVGFVPELQTRLKRLDRSRIKAVDDRLIRREHVTLRQKFHQMKIIKGRGFCGDGELLNRSVLNLLHQPGF